MLCEHIGGEAMESDLSRDFQSQAQSQQQQQQQLPPPPPNPGLMRYRSAPSSYFSNLLDRDIYDEFLNRPSSPDMDRILGGLMSGNPRPRDELLPPEKSKAGIFTQQKQEQEPQLSNYSAAASSSQSFYQSSLQAMLPNQGIDYRPSMGGGGGGLLRQSSSPAGLFLNNLNSIEGYGGIRGMGSFGASPGEGSYSPAARFGNPMNYLPPGQPSSSGQMSPIAEMGNKNVGKSVHSPEGGGFDEGHGNNYDFPLGSWDDSGLNAAQAEDAQGRRGHQTFLARHLSLPTSSSDIDRLLQIQDSVPCKIRAKRGFATHPRSIAERVRRTKISERIRKLQDLVPNMDKQTNTSDMLDLAVDYIKELQDQVKALNDNKSKCVCPNRHAQ